MSSKIKVNSNLQDPNPSGYHVIRLFDGQRSASDLVSDLVKTHCP